MASTRPSVDNIRTSLDRPPTASNAHSLSRAVHARRAEYTRPQKVRIKIGTWNVAACPGTELDLRGWFAEGKGIDRRFAGLDLGNGMPGGNQVDSKDIDAQNVKRNKKESSIPHGDEAVLPGGEEIGLYVLGLQEVVGLTSAKEYIGRVYTDDKTAVRWRNALRDALPPGYNLIVEQQLSGLLLFVFASPALAPTISSVSTVSVGTGVMGYLGNKGAVTTRIVLGETTRIVFVNSHLASGNDAAHLERRCWDTAQILQRTMFDPISWAGVLDDKQESIGDEDFAFWFGDLNFRLDGLPGEDIRRLLTLHTQGEYDIAKKDTAKASNGTDGSDGPIYIHSVESDDDDDEEESTRNITKAFSGSEDDSSTYLPDPDDFLQDPSQDPTSLQATLESLLPHDQLRHVQKKRKAFHDGWREGPIRFLPTYKYDVGSVGIFDSSDKKRSPSWCDRILFRTRRDKMEYDGKSQEEELARIKDEEMKARGMDHAADDDEVLFDYDPEEDGVDTPNFQKDTYEEYDEGYEEQAEEVVTKEGYVDRINLDVYTSHQRVLSSDHKPLNAVFTLDYDAVVPELKSKIQQEVARELDKTENETRPGITIVIEQSPDSDTDIEAHTTPSNEHSTGNAEGVNYGSVAYQQRKTRNVTIANTSQVPATFAFVGRPGATGEEHIAPPWLSVRFVGAETEDREYELVNSKKEITLNPGDTVNVVLELLVDDLNLVKDLNNCKSQLDDVLILRVTDGRDHFIPIRGSWQQSCFGRSIEELTHIPEGGVRALLPARKSSKDSPPVNRGAEVRWSAPRELFKLTEAIELLTTRVIADANMIESAQLPLEVAGWPFDSKSWLMTDQLGRETRRRYVLEALDTDKDLNNSFPAEIPAIERLEIISEVLLLFLDSIPDGIIPSTLWEKLEADFAAQAARPLTDPEDIKSWVLDVLSTSPNHNISFVFLTSMLCRVASELAPVPKSGWRAHAKNSLSSVRRSLSIRNRGTAKEKTEDPAVVRREAVEKAYAEVFAPAIFKGGEDRAGRERRTVDERKREILEAFLKGGRDN